MAASRRRQRLAKLQRRRMGIPRWHLTFLGITSLTAKLIMDLINLHVRKVYPADSLDLLHTSVIDLFVY